VGKSGGASGSGRCGQAELLFLIIIIDNIIPVLIVAGRRGGSTRAMAKAFAGHCFVALVEGRASPTVPGQARHTYFRERDVRVASRSHWSALHALVSHGDQRRVRD
jgi:hypothetical protein